MRFPWTIGQNTSRGRSFALLALIAFVSCFHGEKPPEVAPTHTLTLGSEGSGTNSTKPFAVVFSSPSGETVDPTEVTVLFNRPMRALELAGEESAPPITITTSGGAPAPKGTFRWLGTSAIIYAPETRLARSTEYTVTVPRGTRALSGETLGEAYVSHFTTPSIAVERMSGTDHPERLTPGQTFELRFNQPVDLADIQKNVHLSIATRSSKNAKDAKDAMTPVAIKATYPKPAVHELVLLTPATKLPLDRAVTLALDPALHGTEGPRPMDAPQTYEMRTYAPLSATLVCSNHGPTNKCGAHSGFSVRMNNRVSFGELKKHATVAGAPLAWAKSRDDKELSDSEYIPANPGPSRSVTVTLTAGMKDEFGQALAHDATTSFVIDEEYPSVEIGLAGTVLEASQPDRIPVGAMNVPSVELASVALDEPSVVKLEGVTENERGDRYHALTQVKGASVRRMSGGSVVNARVVETFDVADILGKTRGFGAVGLGYAAKVLEDDRHEVRVVSRTDLAITAKMSRFGSFVRVTKLSDGMPVPNATIAIREEKTGTQLLAVTTDANGTVSIGSDKYTPVETSGEVKRDYLFARVGTDWTWRRVDDMISSWRYGVGTDVAGRLAPDGMLFTDRGVYRPGETVKLKGLFRQPLAKGTRTPVGAAIELTASDAEGTELFKQTTKLGTFGEFAADVPVPATAHLGDVNISASLAADAAHGPTEAGSASVSVLLAAYKAAEFAVHVDPGQKEYVRGDKGMYTVRGDYLFGAPMSSGKVNVSVTRGQTFFSPPGTADLGLSFDDGDYARDLPDTSPRATLLANQEGALDGKGTFAGTVPLALPGQRGAETVSVEAEVQDLSRQSIDAETTFLVHPGEFYLGLKGAGDLFVEKGKNVHPTVMAIEPGGAHRAGVKTHLALIKRTWETVVEENGESGAHYDSKAHDKVAAGCDVMTTATGAVGCDLMPPDSGYFILRATATDKRKNELASSTAVYVTGSGSSFGWPMNDSKELSLVKDKTSYQIGDVAKILVKNPFDHADAILTVERSGVYHEERVTLDGSMPVLTVPVTDDLRPNAFIAVHLVRGRIANANGKDAPGLDLGAPTYRLGYTELTVDPEARRLKVGVTTNKRDYGPGDAVDVNLALNDRAGKPVHGDVTFYAVDEGVLMLTGYKTPDPLPALIKNRELAVFTLETRDDLAKVYAMKAGVGTDKGDEGGGGGSDSSVRQDFKATAFFASDVLTDAAGKAHLQFKLPDNLTTFRLMAVAAAEDDRFGFGEAQVTTSRPLMVRPELPRFLRAGDAWLASAIVTSKGLPEGDVDVSLHATGSNVQADKATQTVHLPKDGNVEVRWPVATPEAGKASFDFAVHVHGQDPADAKTSPKDEAKVTREVQIPLSPEAVALYGETTGAAAEQLADVSKVRKDFGGLDVRLSSSALVGLNDGVEQLIEYPYGCTEQLTSRLVPLLALRDLARDYGIALPANVDAVVGPTLQKILQNQQPGGGFTWWVDSSYVDPWLSAYALWGLHQAVTHGAVVPGDAIENVQKYVRGTLATTQSKLSDLATRAFILDVLAEVGDPDAGYMTKLYEQRKDMPLFARAELAHAMILGKMPPEEPAELLRDAEAHVRVSTNGATIAENLHDEYAPYMDSEAIATAMVLRALLAMDPNHTLGSRLARGLLSLRDHGTWRSTQETAWSLVALDEYRRAQEKTVPSFDAKVFFGQDVLYDAMFKGKSVQSQSASFFMPKLFASGAASGGRLTFEKSGDGTLFYEARLRYARTELPKDGLDRGFFVRKVLRAVPMSELPAAMKTLPKDGVTAANGGDLVLVDLLVVTGDPQRQVVIDDPLPAGLEPVQMDLATNGAMYNGVEPGGEGEQDDADASHDDARASDQAFTLAPYHREMHDDRVLTFIEDMPAGMFHYRYLARATTFGHFVVPPTRVECMYQPETFGRTGASTFDVKVP